jgi:hypothetical protein
MKKKIIYLFFIGLIVINRVAVGQIKIIDAKSKEPIPSVSIFTSNGNLVGQSDEKGIINISVINSLRVSNADNVVIYHLAYKEKMYPKTIFLENHLISLVPDFKNIPEVEINSEYKGKKKYVKYYGYYRSYQTMNYELDYFSDGVIECICPLDNKGHAKVKRLQERSYSQKKLKTYKSTGFTAITNMVGPPMPDLELINEELEKQFIITETNINEFALKSKEYNINVGKVKEVRDSNYLTFNIDIIPQSNPKVMKGFGLESVLEYQNEYSVFQDSTLQVLRPISLLYFRRTTSLKYKAKKDKDFDRYKCTSEFFITNASIVYMNKPEGYFKRTSFNYESNYTNEFWNEFTQHPFYKPTPVEISKELKENLNELTNIRE